MMPTLSKLPWVTFGRKESYSDFSIKCEEQRQRVCHFKKKPLFSIVVPILSLLTVEESERLIEHLSLQTYPYFEVLFCAKPLNLFPIKLAVSKHKFTNAKWVESNEGQLVKLNNLGAKRAIGEWLHFLLPENLLSPAALYLFAQEINNKDCDLIYTNEVILKKHSHKAETYFSKGRFSYFNLLHFNYIQNAWTVKRSAFDTLEGFEPSYFEDAPHVFFLKLIEGKFKFHYLPQYLYFARKSKRKIPNLEFVLFLNEHLHKTQFKAKAQIVDKHIRIQPEILNPNCLISVIICFKDKVEWTLKALQDLKRQVGNLSIEVVLVNNGSTEASIHKIKEGIQDYPYPVIIHNETGPFNFAHMNNQAIRNTANGEFLFLLNNDVFLMGKNSLESLVAWASLPWVGTVGLLLKYQHGGIQHLGLGARLGNQGRLIRVENKSNAGDFSLENREVYGNSFAACLLKRTLYEQVGGLTETDLPNGFGDVAFNLSALEMGFHHLNLSQCEAIHLESGSRGLSYEYWEEYQIEKKFPGLLQKMVREDLSMETNSINESTFWQPIKSASLTFLRVRFPWLRNVKTKLHEATRFTNTLLGEKN